MASALELMDPEIFDAMEKETVRQEDGLELIASATLHDRSLATNPKPVSDAGPIMSVLREAW